MKKNLIAIILLLFIAVLALPAVGGESLVKRVVLISVDGLRLDAVTKSTTPELWKLRKKELSQDRMQAVLPSITLVNHSSMLSGLSPRNHKIDFNRLPAGKVAQFSTIFDLAVENGLQTAFLVNKDKLLYLARPGTVHHAHLFDYEPQKTIAQIAHLTRNTDVQLVFAHFGLADRAGHSSGWMSPEYMKAVSEIDKALGALVKLLNLSWRDKDYALIITSDHGGHEKNHGSSLPEDMRIPWIFYSPQELKLKFNKQRTYQSYSNARTVAFLLGLAPPAKWEGVSILELKD